MGRRVVVTGAGGFVGQEVCAALLREGYSVSALARRNFSLPVSDTRKLTITVVEELATADNLVQLLAGADCVVHLAARVHHTAENPATAALLYDRDVRITSALALAARRAGVQRLVYLSSIKALADRSPDGPLARTTPPKPVDPYGCAKVAAERALAAISVSTGLQVIVIRPPLVYGAGAGANFRQLVRWVRRGIPLPFAGVENRRSLVSVDHLGKFIVRCVGRIEGAYSVFHVSDPESVSTPQLLRYVASALEVRCRLFSVPTHVLESICVLLGKSDIAARLLMSLELETQDSFDELAWRPGASTQEGIIRAVRGMRF